MLRADDDDGMPPESAPLVGSLVGIMNTVPTGWRWKAPAREFAPGFHGANPGPSHPEAAPAPKRKPAAKRVARR